MKLLLGCALLLADALGGKAAPVITRGPYLQSLTTTSVVVRWRTDLSAASFVRYNPDPTELNDRAGSTNVTTEHAVQITDLAPSTRYYYAIATENEVLRESINQFFITAPLTNRPVRMWVIGDSGRGNLDALAVRDGFYYSNSNRHTDVWLTLGDNAYVGGSDVDYQRTFFDIYDRLLPNACVWPALGNHDGDFAAGDLPFLEIFNLPTSGEAGGVASGSERYYSFDYANIHFVCLDPVSSDMSTNGAMLRWLRADLRQNTRDWLIAYMHYPPYSKGSHNSDTEHDLRLVRERVVPVLEEYGADLVLAGHSHSYERSYLIHGHYGASSTLTTNMVLDGGCGQTNLCAPYRKPMGGLGIGRGTVYVVAGCSSQLGGGDFDHPVMHVSLDQLGSLMIDVEGARLDAYFLRDEAGIADHFTLLKEDWPGSPRPQLAGAATATNLVLSWVSSTPVYDLQSAATPSLGWTNVLTPPSLEPRKLSVELSPTNAAQFFRLQKRGL